MDKGPFLTGGAELYGLGLTPNGLFYLGQSAGHDALKDEVWSYEEKHWLKVSYPHYELMWRVNPNETRKLIEAYWSAHIIDWSNLDFSRTAIVLNDSSVFEATWNHEWQKTFSDINRYCCRTSVRIPQNPANPDARRRSCPALCRICSQHYSHR